VRWLPSNSKTKKATLKIRLSVSYFLFF